ncbi:hypothetical protein SEA_CLEARASMUD_18 [Microbacterium phage ClearAsMud]|uniref:Uncharacterized protein n=1 Tax=Microbacterium phage ClearAsMud TaxID=2743404 RepID=A0A7G9A0T9_9CAUD|nr:hypothetical protein QDA07_gp18 [Microbacterium phage ClearAsMud]QNL30228.1 hypothetical protein SEA_CLEARASMUD_18 [Microbacterium phage ClearAsMud]
MHVCVAPGCDRPAAGWAWQHTGPSETDGKRTWGTDLDSYSPMCQSHHKMLDGGGSLTHCSRGHERATTGTKQGECARCHLDRRAAADRARWNANRG